MGVTNELFPNERDGAPASCLYNTTPEDATNFGDAGTQIPSDIVGFADFMRFLAPPAPSADGNSRQPVVAARIEWQRRIRPGALRHVPYAVAGHFAVVFQPRAAETRMWRCFRICSCITWARAWPTTSSQGSAGPDEFRTAPLWGVGQRIFFLHDGRATPANGGLLRAIEDHAGQGSEANQVISLFNESEQPGSAGSVEFPAIVVSSLRARYLAANGGVETPPFHPFSMEGYFRKWGITSLVKSSSERTLSPWVRSP